MPITSGNTRAQYPMQASAAQVVSPSDTVNLNATTTALFISHNNAWSCTVITENGDAVVLSGQGGNVVLPLRITRVNATGFTASLSVIALF